LLDMRKLPVGFICMSILAVPLCACNDTASQPASANGSATKSLQSEAQKAGEHIRDLLYAHCSDGWHSGVESEKGQTFAEVPVYSFSQGDTIDLRYAFTGYEWIGTESIQGHRFLGDTNKSGIPYDIYKQAGVWYFKPNDPRQLPVPIDSLRSIAPSCA
jgi:hypothetical protein